MGNAGEKIRKRAGPGGTWSRTGSMGRRRKFGDNFSDKFRGTVHFHGWPIHFTGMATAGSPVSDPVSGISAGALKLRRQVEMYQWQQSEKPETRQKIGGGEETTTTYFRWNTTTTQSSHGSSALWDS